MSDCYGENLEIRNWMNPKDSKTNGKLEMTMNSFWVLTAIMNFFHFIYDFGVVDVELEVLGRQVWKRSSIS